MSGFLYRDLEGEGGLRFHFFFWHEGERGGFFGRWARNWGAGS